MDLLEVLRGARAVVQAGWMQGEWESQDGTAHCLGGAIFVAMGLDDEQGVYEENKALDVIRALGFERLARLVEWNDADARSKAEVLALIDEAIARAEAREVIERMQVLSLAPLGAITFHMEQTLTEIANE